jgi:tetratricopeptide (TPR) repeat protein
MLWETGDLQAARKTLLDSLAINRELAEQDHNNGEWTRQEYGVYEELGTLSGDPDYFNLGDQPAAANWLQKGLDGKERLLAADPSNARASFDVSEVAADLAAVYRDSDPKRSEKLYRRSLALSEALLKSDPSNAETLHWQALEKIRFAKLLGSTGNHAEATAQLSRALQVANMLVRRDPEDLSFRDLLGVALHETGSHLMQVGAPTEASLNLQQSEQILAKLYSENPNNLMILRDLADCHRTRGDLANSRSNWVDAQREYQKSLDLWQHWTQIGKSSTYDQRQRALAAGRVRDAESHLRRPPAAGAIH